MKRKKTLIASAVLAAVLGFVGCRKTFDQEVKKILMNEYDFTEEEALVGIGAALRWRFMNEQNGSFTFNYNAILLEDQVRKLRDMSNTVSEFLNPAVEQNRRFVEIFNQRGELERQKNVLNYRIDRFEWVVNYKKFERLMRNERILSSSARRDDHNPAGLTDLDIIFPQTDLGQLLRFTARYVEEARANSSLRQVESLAMHINYLEEVPNPDYPAVDPNNQTRWVQRNRSIRITSYDCDNPSDNRADYVEVFRLKPDGSAETSPAIKVFRSQGAGSLDVAVCDNNAEGMRGFGIADDVVELSGISVGSELYDLYRELLQGLFKDSEREHRAPTAESEMETQIVRVGEVRQDEYAINVSTGWTVPNDYRNAGNNNYSLWVKFVDEENVDPHNNSQPRRIEYIARRYYTPHRKNDSHARVVEFYRVKPEYAENIRLVSVDSRTRMLEIVRDGVPAVRGIDALFFANSVPYRIDFDSGDMRISIVDLDNNPTPLYEAKKESARPSELDLRNDAQLR